MGRGELQRQRGKVRALAMESGEREREREGERERGKTVRRFWTGRTDQKAPDLDGGRWQKVLFILSSSVKMIL